MISKMKSKKVYCDECKFIEPYSGLICLATIQAITKDSPWRPNVPEFHGAAACYIRNKKNDCKYFKPNTKPEAPNAGCGIQSKTNKDSSWWDRFW